MFLHVCGESCLPVERTGVTTSETNVPMIEAVQLSKFYGPFVAVKEISFQINRGEVVAFLGPNGDGKSTTMKLLTGFLSPSTG